MLTLPNDLANHTPADASPVQQNFEYIEQYVNAEVITRDGRVGMAAQLSLVGDPVAPLDAAPRQYVDAVLPLGVVLPYCGIAAPAGGKWALANGAQLNSGDYPKLYDMIGYRYGGSGGLFNLPNLTGRVIIGLDQRLAPDFDERFNLAGETGGTFVVPIPQHSHPQTVHQHTMAHTHEMPHMHSIAHDHAAFNSVADGGHTHVATTARRTSGPGSTESLMPAGTTGTNDTSTSSVTISPVADHTHSINVPAYAGNSGQPDDATTDGSSAANTGNSTAVNTGNTGVTGLAAQMVPPYIVMAYIVRIA